MPGESPKEPPEAKRHFSVLVCLFVNKPQRHIWFDPGAPGETRISKNSTKRNNHLEQPGELGWSSDFETWSVTLIVFGIRVGHTHNLTLELSNPGFCLENLNIFDGFRRCIFTDGFYGPPGWRF